MRGGAVEVGVKGGVLRTTILALLAVALEGDEAGEQAREVVGAFALHRRGDAGGAHKLLVAEGPLWNLSDRPQRGHRLRGNFAGGMARATRSQGQLDVGDAGELDLRRVNRGPQRRDAFDIERLDRVLAGKLVDENGPAHLDRGDEVLDLLDVFGENRVSLENEEVRRTRAEARDDFLGSGELPDNAKRRRVIRRRPHCLSNFCPTHHDPADAGRGLRLEGIICHPGFEGIGEPLFQLGGADFRDRADGVSIVHKRL